MTTLNRIIIVILFLIIPQLSWARYYEPKVGMWITIDPVFQDGQYFPTGNTERDSTLPGIGGVYNSVNLNLYHYAGLNPVKLVDPDGTELQATGTKSEVLRNISVIEKATGTKLEYSMGSTGKRGNEATYTANITDFKSVDNRFSTDKYGGKSIQDKLRDIITSEKTVTVRFDVDGKDQTYWNGTGSFDMDTGVASLNTGYLKNDEPKMIYGRENSGSLKDRMGLGKELYMTSWDVMAHELIGHGHDYVSGIHEDRQWNAQNMQNTVRELLGIQKIDDFPK